MFKVNNRNTKIKCEICSKLIIKIPERRHGFVPLVFAINGKAENRAFVQSIQITRSSDLVDCLYGFLYISDT